MRRISLGVEPSPLLFLAALVVVDIDAELALSIKGKTLWCLEQVAMLTAARVRYQGG